MKRLILSINKIKIDFIILHYNRIPMLQISKILTHFPSLLEYLRNYQNAENVPEIPTTFEEDIEKYNSYLTLGTEYFYLVNLVEPSIIYVSDNMTSILGYTREEFTFEKLLESIHPEDREKFIKFSVLMVEFARKSMRGQYRFDFTAQIDYRQQRKNGTYIRILRQTGIYKLDETGQMTHNIAMCTNISSIKKTNNVEAAIYKGTEPIEGFEEIEKYIKEEIEDKLDNILTKTELQIIKLLSEGKTSKQIAHFLTKSIYTINTHRKHILDKLKVHNSTEALLICKNNGWV